MLVAAICSQYLDLGFIQLDVESCLTDCDCVNESDFFSVNESKYVAKDVGFQSCLSCHSLTQAT